jgi:hypothetical protein
MHGLISQIKKNAPLLMAGHTKVNSTVQNPLIQVLCVLAGSGLSSTCATGHLVVLAKMRHEPHTISHHAGNPDTALLRPQAPGIP